jgi:hypothetical protein
LDISPTSENKFVLSGLAAAVAEAKVEDPLVCYGGSGVLLVAWWGSLGGMWRHWHPRD